MVDFDSMSPRAVKDGIGDLIEEEGKERKPQARGSIYPDIIPR